MNVILMLFPLAASGVLFILTLKILPKTMLTLPLDGKLTIRGKRIFGENKTIRGPLFMSLYTMLFGLIVESNLLIAIKYLFIGLLYSLGELPNSFIKRQLGINPGEPPKSVFFRTLDLVDSLIFCGIGYKLLFNYSTGNILIAIVLGIAIHYLTDQLMKYLGIKK